MIKKFSFLIFFLLNFFNNICKKIFGKNFLPWINYFIQEKLYKSIKIDNRNINFFTPNSLVDWRVDTFYTKEPETLNWIDTFKKDSDTIFWDIGANIGLYSIYNALKNSRSTTYCIEPSTSNLRVLSQNISINKLSDRIKILPTALTDKKISFLDMKEAEFIEGGALNSYGEDFDFEGKKFEGKINYKIFGTTIDHLIDSKILPEPDYIKIDVDGIEHLILKGGSNCLKNKKLKSLSIEINENFVDQFEQTLDIMKKNNFKILQKKNNIFMVSKKSKFINSFNYIFSR